MQRMAPAWQELRDYFTPLIDARRSDQSGEDLIAMLAEGERQGTFTRDQSLANAAHMMMAGHETTRDLVTNGVLAFVRNPDQWDLLQRDPEGMCASAVEECLRYEPPGKGVFRVAVEDVEIGGQTIPAGDQVYWMMSSANRDPRVFADPDTFDITRSPNPHVAFGGGIHHCIGAALARIEGQETFRALAEMLPRLQLQDEEVRYVPSLLHREPCCLNVSWS